MGKAEVVDTLRVPRGVAMITSTSGTSRPKTSGGGSLLREQLAEFNGPAKGPVDMRGGRTALGWLITVCGIAVSGWLLFVIHGAIFRPEKLGMPLRNLKAEDLAMAIPSGKVQIPAVAVTLVGYLLVVLLLGIGGKIAVAMLKLGAALLGNDAVSAEMKKLDT
jgi:hypothetical protein